MRGLSVLNARALGALLLLLALAWPRRAAAEDLTPPLTPAARQLYEAGLAHYGARRFPEAIQALRAAYVLEPRREILFAEAQATRLGGDCAAAVPLYQRFLDSNPPPRQLEAARIALARCQAAAAAPIAPPGPAAAPVTPAPAPPPAVAAPAPAAATTPPPPRGPWYRDPTGMVLAGSAAVALGVGTGFVIAARQANARADRESRYGPYDVHRVQAESRLRTGRLLMLGAGILAVGAAGRFAWLSWSPDGREARLALGGRF